MHTYTPTDSIFDGHVTNLFSNLSLLLLVFRVSMAVKGLITVVEVGGCLTITLFITLNYNGNIG